MKELKVKIKARVLVNKLCDKCSEERAVSKIKIKYLYSKHTYLLCEHCLFKTTLEELR